jgi:hypothetical protein
MRWSSKDGQPSAITRCFKSLGSVLDHMTEERFSEFANTLSSAYLEGRGR